MKIFNLIYNELIKQFKKPSIKIIYSLILISAIVLPMIISKMPYEKYAESALESNKFLLQQCEENVELYKEDKETKGKILYQYALIEKEHRELFVDYKIGIDDWREKQAGYFSDSAYDLAALEFALAGYNKDVVMQNLQGVNPEKVESYYKMSYAKKKEMQQTLIEEKENQRKIIDNNDYNAYTREAIERIQDFILENKKTIEKYNKLKEKNPTTEEGKANLKSLEKYAKSAEIQIPRLEQDIKILQFRLENNINYDLNNWKNNSIKTIEENIWELRIPLMTEKEYSTAAAQQGYSMSYDEYVENYKEKNERIINEIKQLWHGLKNNIPALNDIRDARSTLNGIYEIYIILAVVMVIIIGGGIVASEFSKGTIRLLLIRPVSRWKILLSKLATLLVVGLSIVALGTGILYLSSGFVFGFETYKTPILETVNGAIVHVSFMKFLLSKILLSSTSLVFISALVFAISTLAKNTALSVAISMLLYLGTAPAVDFLIGIKQTWLINTLIPYINASYFRLIPMTSQLLSEKFGMTMQYNLGAIQLLIASAIILVITFVVFMKKDIKN